MTGRGKVAGSSRVRRKPQPIYDTAPLASEEQLSQQVSLKSADSCHAEVLIPLILIGLSCVVDTSAPAREPNQPPTHTHTSRTMVIPWLYDHFANISGKTVAFYEKQTRGLMGHRTCYSHPSPVVCAHDSPPPPPWRHQIRALPTKKHRPSSPCFFLGVGLGLGAGMLRKA